MRAYTSAINESRYLGMLEVRSDRSARIARGKTTRDRNLDSRAMSRAPLDVRGYLKSL